MSQLITYRVDLPKGAVTIDQLVDVMQAMGLKPQLLKDRTEVQSWTGEDSFSGNLKFTTSPLGGFMRQKDGIANVIYDAKTRVVTGELVLRIDSFGTAVKDRTEAMTANLGKAMAKLTEAVARTAEVTKSTSFVLPGLTVEEAREIAMELGARIASPVQFQHKEKVNLAAAYLGRKNAAAALKVGGASATVDQESNLLQIAPEALTVSINVPKANGHGSKRIEIGVVPPCAALEKTKGGVKVTLPQVFFDKQKLQWQNLQSLGLAVKMAQNQAEKHVGATEVVPHVLIEQGKLKNFSVDWEKPAEGRKALSQTAQERLAQRKAAVESGKVEVIDAEKTALFDAARTHSDRKPIDRDQIRRRIVAQANEKGISQFVLA